MDYNLAKQLKVVGYNQGVGKLVYDKQHDEHLVFPTLSELIEACGDDVILFHDKENKIWCAGHIGMYPNLCYGEYYIDEELHHLSRGENPEEAVANLYLQINSK